MEGLTDRQTKLTVQPNGRTNRRTHKTNIHPNGRTKYGQTKLTVHQNGRTNKQTDKTNCTTKWTDKLEMSHVWSDGKMDKVRNRRDPLKNIKAFNRK